MVQVAQRFTVHTHRLVVEIVHFEVLGQQREEAADRSLLSEAEWGRRVDWEGLDVLQRQVPLGVRLEQLAVPGTLEVVFNSHSPA